MLTNGSLQGVTILKDKSLEDNTGVACHPDKKILQPKLQDFFCIVPADTAGMTANSFEISRKSSIFAYIGNSI